MKGADVITMKSRKTYDCDIICQKLVNYVLCVIHSTQALHRHSLLAESQ
jgi:hypothetical protein